MAELAKRMNAADAWFLYFEKPHAPLHIGSLGIFDGDIPVQATIDGVAERIHLIPRYRQRAVFPPLFSGHPTWEDDPKFALDRHIREEVLPAPGDEAQLRELCASVCEERLPRDRPLWDITVVRGLEGGRSAYISRVHHCLVDGVSGMELLMALLDLTPNPPPPAPPDREWSPAPQPTPVESWADGMLDSFTRNVLGFAGAQRQALDAWGSLRRMTDFAQSLARALPAAIRLPAPTIWNRPVGRRRRFAFSTISFQEVRAIRSALGGTVNDVALVVLAGALGRYLEEHGVRTRGKKLRLMTPVNVRSETERGDLGNRVSMMLPELPVDIDDVVKRLEAVREEIGRMKSSEQGRVFDQVARLGENAPAAFHALAGMGGIPAGMINLVCTNVPGPLIPLYAAGKRMVANYPLLPLTGDLGLGVAITSYDNSLNFGIACDPTIVADVERIGELLDEEFVTLRNAAGVPASDLPDIGIAADRAGAAAVAS